MGGVRPHLPALVVTFAVCPEDLAAAGGHVVADVA